MGQQLGSTEKGAAHSFHWTVTDTVVHQYDYGTIYVKLLLVTSWVWCGSGRRFD